MPTPRRLFVDTTFGQMHVRMSKSQKDIHLPLICLHMSPQSGGAFSNFMAQASKNRRVIAPDYHGFGESDLPPKSPHVTIDDYARTVWQALDALTIGRVDLLGHHTGSKVAAEMAHQQPDRVKSIIMVSASVMTKEVFEAERSNKTFDPISLDKAGTRLTTLWTGFQKFYPPGTPLELLFKFVLDAFRPGEAYQWGNRAAFMYNGQFPAVLQGLGQKITVFNPNDDLYEVTPKIMTYLGNGRLIDKPNWKHGFFDTHTDEAVREILGAIDGSDEV